MPSLLWQLQHSDDDDDDKEDLPPDSSFRLPKIQEEEEGDDQGSSDGGISSMAQLPGFDSSYDSFVQSHPKFAAAGSIDEAREYEYPHLRASGRACFDYCGIGLFTRTPAPRSADFALATVPPGNIAAHAAYGGGGGDLEGEVRSRVKNFLNVADGYSLVFAASKRAAFSLVAAAYDFSSRPRLLTVYDHESESVRSLVAAAREARARPTAATFRWPSLAIRGEELAAELKRRRWRRGGGGSGGGGSGGGRRGLFVFPTQSRITGAKYSYQWMSMAEKHHWDVLLDVSAMGPKDMASLGLSLFRPDFIVCSFYRSFGNDPTGFGCLLIKDSSLHGLRSANPSSGMVRIVPILSPTREGDDEENPLGEPGRPIIAFSGPVLSPASSGMGFQHCSSEIGHWENDEDESSKGKSPLANGSFDHQHHHFIAGSDTSSSFAGQSEIEEELEQQHREHRNGSHLPSSSSSSSAVAAAPCSSSSLSNSLEDDAVFRRISRDEGLIDSRRSDMFRRFLPIREDIEEDDQHPQQQQQDQQQQQQQLGIAETSKSSWDAEGDYYYDEEVVSDEGWAEYEDDDYEGQQAPRPLIVCSGLDLVSSLGLNMTNSRIKSLMDWLITSMSSLVHRIYVKKSGSLTTKSWRFKPVVQIYGPKSQPDRGPAVAFNVYDHRGVMIQPSMVQKLADRHGISLGTGVLSNVFIEGDEGDDYGNSSGDGDGDGGNGHGKQQQQQQHAKGRNRKMPDKCSSFIDPHPSGSRIAAMKRMNNTPVLTATLGLVSNFEDVYRLWEFAAKFLDPDFLTGELLHYQSINQETVVVGINS